MNWTPTELNAFLSACEQGDLQPEELARARAPESPLQPLTPGLPAWTTFADRTMATAGALLLAVGVVFFFAFNWKDLHRFTKFGLAEGFLIATVLASLWVGSRVPVPLTLRAAALSSAFIATGVVLALIGQTYQTGADLWQLFAAWAALGLPLVVASLTPVCWVMWVLVANLALSIYLGQWYDLLHAQRLLSEFTIAGIANLAMLVIFEALNPKLLARPSRMVQRLLGLAVLLPLTAAACMVVVGDWAGTRLGNTALTLLVYGLTAGAMVWVYRWIRRDLALVGLALFSAIAVSTTALVRLLSHANNFEFLAFNLIAAYIACSSALAVWWLRKAQVEPT